ncbi:hypothetical protein D3C87_1998530 [compost metagenome]
MAAPANAVVARILFRASRLGSIGAFTRRSIKTNATAQITAIARVDSVSVTQPWELDSVRA